MTREEIDQVLFSAHHSRNPEVASLARVLVDQERRLRALEPCTYKSVSGNAHLWTEKGDHEQCAYCQVERKAPR